MPKGRVLMIRDTFVSKKTCKVWRKASRKHVWLSEPMLSKVISASSNTWIIKTGSEKSLFKR